MTCPGMVFVLTTCPGMVLSVLTTCPGMVLFVLTTCRSGLICADDVSRNDLICAAARPPLVVKCSNADDLRVKKPDIKSKPESGTLILCCEAPLTDQRRSCEMCATAGPWCNCPLGHMKLCEDEIFANCGFCQRVVCGRHLSNCYCFRRISIEKRFRAYRDELEKQKQACNQILWGVLGTSGSSKDNPRSGLREFVEMRY